eukprot:4858908-Pyramimonas_sp.AAC.1
MGRSLRETPKNRWGSGRSMTTTGIEPTRSGGFAVATGFSTSPLVCARGRIVSGRAGAVVINRDAGAPAQTPNVWDARHL